MDKSDLAKLAALEKLLHGEPPYPIGTLARQLQDERGALRAQAKGASDVRE